MSSAIWFYVSSKINPYGDDESAEKKPSKPAGNSAQNKRLARQVVVRARKGDFVAELIGFETKSGKGNILVQRKKNDGSYEKLSISPRTEVFLFEALKIDCSTCHETIGCQYFKSAEMSYCETCPGLRIHGACDLRDGKIEAMDHPDPETCDSCKKGWDDFRGSNNRW